MSRSVKNISNCTNMKLRKATRLVTQAYDTEMQLAGINSTQFTLLATLKVMGNPAITKLAEMMVMDRTTLSRNIKPLIDKGLVTSVSEQDQRVRQICLTLEGEALLSEGMPHWHKIQDAIVQKLGEQRWDQFLTDLEVVIEVMKTDS
jgi:DNA-binding MarR family transcriptional regulator